MCFETRASRWVGFRVRKRQIFPLGVQAAIFTVRAAADQGGGESSAFETHGPASVGEGFIPGDEVVGAFVAVDWYQFKLYYFTTRCARGSEVTEEYCFLLNRETAFEQKGTS